MYWTGINKWKPSQKRIQHYLSHKFSFFRRFLSLIYFFYRYLFSFVFSMGILYPSCLLAAPRMPWDDSLMVVQNSLTGTTAHILIIIAIAMSGLLWALGEQGSMIQKAGKIIFGGSIATGAVSICAALKLVGGGY